MKFKKLIKTIFFFYSFVCLLYFPYFNIPAVIAVFIQIRVYLKNPIFVLFAKHWRSTHDECECVSITWFQSDCHVVCFNTYYFSPIMALVFLLNPVGLPRLSFTRLVVFAAFRPFAMPPAPETVVNVNKRSQRVV